MTYPFHIDSAKDAANGSEKIIQLGFRNAMKVKAPNVMLVGIPNAGRRTAWEARERMAEGMVPGFPDMLALYQGRTFGLEFKSKTGTVSDKQIDCLNKLVRHDFPVGVFRSAETAMEWLRGHGVPVND